MATNKVSYGRKAVKQSPPKWISIVTACLMLLISSKTILIGSFPGATDEIKEFAGLWFDYVMNTLGVIFSLASIFTGVENKNRPIIGR